ncbi:hypothetical protein GLAREA_04912 [Glarea lozoyensis ATCC 20868]|uniref:Uncharacterized protein n=1 Tax=Glarea lozoyensis (strain ATCC 20868 / MF5171) TaxID=1116229 RepID=S3D7Y1_GLAL2|nr:uncharacterized protein GLAREA_04912 [Glarea lozoyensis ATCC 20868]EPE28121.1 hypothetical protein GLAREA_04912 [Glarea lozoyensis ATCC 20868]
MTPKSARSKRSRSQKSRTTSPSTQTPRAGIRKSRSISPATKRRPKSQKEKIETLFARGLDQDVFVTVTPGKSALFPGFDYLKNPGELNYDDSEDAYTNSSSSFTSCQKSLTKSMSDLSISTHPGLHKMRTSHARKLSEQPGLKEAYNKRLAELRLRVRKIGQELSERRSAADCQKQQASLLDWSRVRVDRPQSCWDEMDWEGDGKWEGEADWLAWEQEHLVIT